MRNKITVEHRIHESRRTFAEVVTAFEDATGSVEEGFAQVDTDATDGTAFEAAFKAREGSSGFMRFMRIDHGRWFSKFGIKGKSILFILGNPLIARTMLVHDIGAGLNVPVRLTIEENDKGSVRVVYDLPSTLMSALANANVTAAAEILDAKLIALGEHISGALS